MTRALVWHWEIVVVSVLAVGLIAGLTLGIALLPGKSDETLAAELARNSPEVQDALGGGRVEVLESEVRDDEAWVICTNETGEFVTVQVYLEEKEVVKVTSHVSPADGEMPDLDGETLETTTDNSTYALGEGVTIEISNTSPETITGGGVYYFVYDLEGNWVAGNGLFLAFELQPGEGLHSLIWNQTDKEGKQVESGTYVVQGQAGDYSDATLIHIG
jgi:hypothetical protein